MVPKSGQNWDGLLLGSIIAALISAGACTHTRVRPPSPPPLSAAATTYYLRGRVATLRGQKRRARFEFAKAAQVAPDQPEIVLAYARALLESGKTNETLIVSKRAANRWPKHHEFALIVGLAYRKLGQLADAVVALKHALDLDASSIEAALALAPTLDALGQPENAIREYKRAIAHHPDQMKPRIKLAQLYRQLPRSLLGQQDPLQLAIEILVEVLDQRPTHSGARVLLSDIYAAQNHPDLAITTLTNAVIHSLNQGPVIKRLLIRLMKFGFHRRAVAFLEALDSTKLSVDTRRLIINWLIRLGYPARGLAVAVAFSPPISAQVTLAKAHALAKLHRYGDAASMLKTLSNATDSPSLAPIQAEFLTLAGEPDEAKKLVYRVLISAPSKEKEPASTQPTSATQLTAQGWITLARIEELHGNDSEARKLVDRALAAGPSDPEIRFWAAAFELRARRFGRALAFAEPLLKQRPTHAVLNHFVGFCLTEANSQLNRASKLLRRAQRVDTNNPTIIDSIGWLQFRLGHLTDAAKTLRRAWRLAPTDPNVLFHLGHLEFALGRPTAGIYHFKQALAATDEPTLQARIRAAISTHSPSK